MGILNKIEDEFYEQLGRLAWKKIKGKLEPKDILKASVNGLEDIWEDIESETEEFAEKIVKLIKSRIED